jgi:hypothetical protein
VPQTYLWNSLKEPRQHSNSGCAAENIPSHARIRGNGANAFAVKRKEEQSGPPTLI